MTLLHGQNNHPPASCSRLWAERSFSGTHPEDAVGPRVNITEDHIRFQSHPISDHLPGSSMWTMIQLKATSAPIFPVKYTAFRHASRGKPISASCITDDSSMSDATEHTGYSGVKKSTLFLLVLASLRPLSTCYPKNGLFCLICTWWFNCVLF